MMSDILKNFIFPFFITIILILIAMTDPLGIGEDSIKVREHISEVNQCENIYDECSKLRCHSNIKSYDIEKLNAYQLTYERNCLVGE